MCGFQVPCAEASSNNYHWAYETPLGNTTSMEVLPNVCVLRMWEDVKLLQGYEEQQHT